VSICKDGRPTDRLFSLLRKGGQMILHGLLYRVQRNPSTANRQMMHGKSLLIVYPSNLTIGVVFTICHMNRILSGHVS